MDEIWVQYFIPARIQISLNNGITLAHPAKEDKSLVRQLGSFWPRFFLDADGILPVDYLQKILYVIGKSRSNINQYLFMYS